mgnify:CR=1 FL=1
MNFVMQYKGNYYTLQVLCCIKQYKVLTMFTKMTHIIKKLSTGIQKKNLIPIFIHGEIIRHLNLIIQNLEQVGLHQE